MSELFRVIVAALGRKERTAKVYAATIRRIHREIYKKELEDKTFAFLRLRKTYNYVRKIVNLTRRKNAATAVLVGLQATKAPDKLVEKFRKIMMDSDKDYQQFLTSGQRKRPFADAENAWKLVTELHKKANQEINARRLWDVGSHVNSDEYRVLMAWLYLKWMSAMPPRRLEYSTTRLVTPAEYAASGKTENYVVMNKRGWTWNLHSYKTMEKYGVQILAIPGPLKAALNKIKPIIDAKNDKGYIFLNNKFRTISKSQFSFFVKQVWKKYAGKDWTQNTIRSIKVSSVWTPGTENPIKLAEAMGHDIKTAILHYKA